MPFTVNLTDIDINASRLGTAGQQMVVQGSDYLPIVVDLTSPITIGRAILIALSTNDNLWAQFNSAKEEDILRSITSIAFIAPANTMQLLAYAGSSTHKRPIVATEITYLPFSRLYRNYISGGTSSDLLDVGVAL